MSVGCSEEALAALPPGRSKRAAVVLLSGGLDSATSLAIAREEGFSLYALSFGYGQRHAAEIGAARRVARACGVAQHLVVPLDLRWMEGTALCGKERKAVPKERSSEQMGAGIPSTYVPARNTIFLSYAVAWSEVLGANAIYIGVNAVDYSGYPDCRAAFIAAFERAANLGTRATVEWNRRLAIHTPLIDQSKSAIIRRGLALGVDYSLTRTCYDPEPRGACGLCDACQLRLRGFAEAGLEDPIRYVRGQGALHDSSG